MEGKNLTTERIHKNRLEVLFSGSTEKSLHLLCAGNNILWPKNIICLVVVAGVCQLRRWILRVY